MANVQTPATGETPVPLSAWRWWLPPAIISLVVTLIFVDPFIGDWDALDYTVSALRGQPSSMALGRGLFIFYNHALYVVAHALFPLPPEHAYLLFKYAVVAQAPLAVIACWKLAHNLSRSVSSATVAALFVCFSPAFVVYSGQVMTDVPAVLLLTLAIVIHLRGIQRRRFWLVLAGAALLGLGVNLRETIGFFGLWLVLGPFVCGWRPKRQELTQIALSCVVFFVLAFAGFAYWFLSDPSYRQAWFGWRESMRVESIRHLPALQNVVPWLVFFFATSPLLLITLLPAFVSEWRRHKLSPTPLLAALGLVANGLLLFNYSTAVVWRYLLTGLPVLAPLCGDYLVRLLTIHFKSQRAAFTCCAVGIALTGVLVGAYVWPLRSDLVIVRAASKEYDRQLLGLPRDAVMISGAQTVAVNYWRALGKGEWDVIGVGSGWPGSQLASVVETYLTQGRRVFVDADQRWWQPCGWHVPEIEDLARLESRFRFRRVTQTIYEIRPSSDATAVDKPDLQSLLPPNRPEAVRRCFNPG
jgi:hypothetical protein